MPILVKKKHLFPCCRGVSLFESLFIHACFPLPAPKGQHGGGGRLWAVPARCGGEGQARRKAHLKKESVQAHRPQEALHGGGEPLLDGPGDAQR